VNRPVELRARQRRLSGLRAPVWRRLLVVSQADVARRAEKTRSRCYPRRPVRPSPAGNETRNLSRTRKSALRDTTAAPAPPPQCQTLVKQVSPARVPHAISPAAITMSSTGLTWSSSTRSPAALLRCWASQPVPDKYAFQATDERTNRRTSPLRKSSQRTSIIVVK